MYVRGKWYMCTYTQVRTYRSQENISTYHLDLEGIVRRYSYRHGTIEYGLSKGSEREREGERAQMIVCSGNEVYMYTVYAACYHECFKCGNSGFLGSILRLRRDYPSCMSLYMVSMPCGCSRKKGNRPRIFFLSFSPSLACFLLVFFNPADPRGITQGGLPGFPTQLDIYFLQVVPRVDQTTGSMHCPIANSASTQSQQPVQDG